MTPLRRIDPTSPVQLLIGRATTNLASGIHHEVYDCDNHNEAAEYAAKLEAGLLPSNVNAGLRFKMGFLFRCLTESALEPKADLKEVKCHFRNVPCMDGSELARTFFTYAALVGAAMCSACRCGSHDRWP